MQNSIRFIRSEKHPGPVQVANLHPHDHERFPCRNHFLQFFPQRPFIQQAGDGLPRLRRAMVHNIAGENVRLPVPAVIQSAAAGHVHIGAVLALRPVFEEVKILQALQRHPEIL